MVAVVAAAVGLAGERRIVGVRVGKRDCTASVERDCKLRNAKLVEVDDFVLDRQMIGKIRGAEGEVAGIRLRVGHRRIVEETCTIVVGPVQ